MPTVSVGDVSVHFEEWGTGETIVWIPGTGLLGSSWHRQVAKFEGAYRCLTVDLRGSGRTTGGAADYSVADLAADVAGLLDAVGGGPAHVVGLSLGSAIAQELVLHRPDLVRSVVLLSTWSSTVREHHIRRHFESRLYAIERGPLDVFAQFAFWMSAPSVIDEEPELQRQVESDLAAHNSNHPEGTAGHFRADLTHETRDRLAQIGCPTLVMYGAEDLITLPAYNECVAALVPGAQKHVIDRAGHLAWLERSDEVNDRIAAFLAGVEGAK